MTAEEIAKKAHEAIEKEPKFTPTTKPVVGGDRNPFAHFTIVGNDGAVYRLTVKRLVAAA